MEENIIQGEEIVIKANGRKDNPINELALISARSFTVEETEKYAGSWQDPARMASNFAGVMSAVDQVNDIIIRGNSPAGLLWRMDGINIPNPNHFGGLGQTGGPISMLNNNVLCNSDFYSGAFPSEYGNALSGVFDLNIRSGNNEKREYVTQVGMNGFEFGAEGPIIKTNRPGKNPTFLFNYRYSTLSVFDKMGIDMGIGAIPYYQDVNFKFDLPGTKYGRFTVFGIGGYNYIEFDDKDTIKPHPIVAIGAYGNPDTIIARKDYTYFSSIMGASGFSHTYFFNENTRIKTSLAASYAGNGAESNGYRWDELSYDYSDDFWETTYTIKSDFKKKFNSRNYFNIGIIADWIFYGYKDNVYNEKDSTCINRYDENGNLKLLQGYSSWKHNLNENITMVGGIHYQQSSLDNKWVIEPRFNMEWKLNKKQSVSFGYGLHSQLPPRSIYYIKTLVDTLNKTYEYTNLDLDFTKSHHFILGYNYLINHNLRIKSEAYYQSIYNVPVNKTKSYISLLNYGSGSYYINTNDLDSLVNKGTGYNYGFELTIEKFLSNNFYYMFTSSIFNSKYTDLNGKERNTLFNGNYVFNILGGYEFELKNQHSLAFDVKGVWAGGLRSTPVLIDESIIEASTVYDDSKTFEEKNENYYRVDVRVSYIINRPKVTHTISIDVRNVTNHINPFIQEFDIETAKIEKVSQLGIVPAVLWRLNF